MVPADEPPPLPINAELSVIGKRSPRIDVGLKVTGRARYTSDIRLPNMLYGQVHLSTYPHARVKEQLNRLHAPIGLNIGVDTPPKIALEIIAEIQKVLTGRSGRSLKDHKAPIHQQVESTPDQTVCIDGMLMTYKLPSKKVKQEQKYRHAWNMMRLISIPHKMVNSFSPMVLAQAIVF